MKKFVFSLESVLKAKEVMDRQKSNELALAADKVKQATTELAYLEQKRKHSSMVFFGWAEEGVTAKQAEGYYLNLSRLRDAEAEKTAALVRYKKEEAEIRLQLIEIRRDKKMLEILREKKLYEYHKEMQAEEERLMDELVSFKEAAGSLQEVL